ncbi:hypothetical protein LB505_012456 [Fusarium chuoi]|nr:hypothetical protein LB505_012456 [Fusarium chuoi]
MFSSVQRFAFPEHHSAAATSKPTAKIPTSLAKSPVSSLIVSKMPALALASNILPRMIKKRDASLSMRRFRTELCEKSRYSRFRLPFVTVILGRL